jgi:hypothetical protein
LPSSTGGFAGAFSALTGKSLARTRGAVATRANNDTPEKNAAFAFAEFDKTDAPVRPPDLHK